MAPPKTTAGYSGTPLPQKLGVKPGARVALVDAPQGFALDLPAGGAALADGGGKAKGLDVIVWFVTARAAFAAKLASVAARLQPAGGLWIAWPKKASGVATDMTENVVRDVALPTGLVDNKVCAIDDTWSGLRLVVRLENRPKPAPAAYKFGDNGEKVDGKLFALDVRGALVVKLPKARVDELVAAKKGTRFELGARVMKEWLVVTAPKSAWPALRTEAKAFVGGSAEGTATKRPARRR